MSNSLPIPDFDFDEDPLIPIDAEVATMVNVSATQEIISFIQSFGLNLISTTPIRCTGTSYVYKAEDNFKNIYAVKYCQNPQRIQMEFEKRKQLPENRYIVSSVNYFEKSKSALLQMELCKDGDLAGKHFTEKQIWKIIFDISSALEIVHSHGWIHLDVSPSNILYNGQDFKLADFGTLIREGEFKLGNEGAGPYVSPEAISFPGDSNNPIQVTYKTDIFSFGVVLLELASGFFAPRGTDEKYSQLRSGEIMLGDNIYNCDMSHDLISLINQMILPDANCRPSASDLVQYSRTHL